LRREAGASASKGGEGHAFVPEIHVLRALSMSGRDSTSVWGGWGGAVAAAAVTGLLYFAAARAVIVLNDPVNLGAGFWPGAGITLTALLLCPARWWPAILAAVGLAELGNDVSLGYGVAPALWWTTANVVEPLVAAWLVRRLRADSFATVRSVVLFVVAAAVFAPVIGSALGAMGSIARDPSFSYLGVMARWAIGDGLGVLAITPTGLLLLRNRSSWRALRSAEAVVCLLVVVAACVVIFGAGIGVIRPHLVVPPLLWAAIRLRVTGAAVSTFLAAQIANLATGLGHGPFTAAADAGQAILSLQAFLVTMTVTMLVVGARTQESAGYQLTAQLEQRRADVEDALTRLGQAALDSTDHDQLQRQAVPILEPVIGPAATRQVIGCEGELPAAVDDDRQPQEQEQDAITEARLDGFVHEARALLGSARRRIDAEQHLQGALAELDESTQLVRLLLDSTGQGLYGIDLDGRCTFVNRSAVELLGYDDQADLLGRNMHELIHHTRADGTAYPAHECRVNTALRERRGVHCDDELLFRRDGTGFSAEYRSHPVERDGELIGAVVTFEDVTARRQAEERLHHSQSLLRVAGSLARVGGWAIELPDNKVFWSEEIYEILEHVGSDPPSLAEGIALYPPQDRDRVSDAIARCATDGTPFDLELELVTFQGTGISVQLVAEAERADDGTITRVIGAMQDVTELRQVARESSRLAARLTTTLESITDAFFTLDREWRFTYVNRRAEEVLRRTRGSLLGRSIWEEFPETVGSAAEGSYVRALREGRTEVLDEYFYPPLDTWFAIRAYPSAQGLAVYFQDITEQRQARLALQDREERLAEQAALLDKARDAILVRSLDHRITYWNRSAEVLYGWTAEDAVGQSVRELLYRDRAAFDEATETVLADGEWLGEVTQVRKDGSELVAECRWTLVRDGDGTPQSILAINTDITDRKRLEAQFLRAQRLESIGTLAGGLAHDLNNVFAPIVLSIDLLRSEDVEEQRAEILDVIAASAQRGAEMVRQVLSFARGVEGHRIEVDTVDLLRDIERMTNDTFLKTIRTVREDDSDVWRVIGDPTQLHQVLINLCVNARDAMPHGGTLRIGARNVEVEAGDAARTVDSQPGRYVCISVTDDGEGMLPEVRDRIFEPFFTTKELGRGTGLGLSTSAGIIKGHGGFVRVDSEPGAGTTFRVYLPAAVDVAAPMEQPHAEARPRGRGELVLVVDDEDHVRELTRQTLEASGYRVLEASGGAEALEVLGHHRGAIDLAITDMMMPGMDGPTTIRELRSICPKLRIMATSGLHGTPTVAAATTEGAGWFLPKPYSSATLLQTVRSVLDDVHT
jgi:two-component system, cell cycle sensor histidine kinase and response regulator CckA